jgi:hypothetical protein
VGPRAVLQVRDKLLTTTGIQTPDSPAGSLATMQTELQDPALISSLYFGRKSYQTELVCVNMCEKY